MPNNYAEQDDPRELRFAFPEPPAATLSLRGAESKTLPAKLLDLAQGGAKIALQEEVEPQHARLQLGDRATVDGEVRWCWRSETGPWIAGCSFAPALPDATFAAIVAGGRLDRLKISRPDAIVLSAQGELSGTGEQVTLQNHSTHGLCLATHSPMVTGERLRLKFSADEPLDFAARVQWQLELEVGYLVGCRFTSSCDPQLLADALDLAAASAVAP